MFACGRSVPSAKNIDWRDDRGCCGRCWSSHRRNGDPAVRTGTRVPSAPYGPVPAAAVLALGAVGAVPPGLGVVEGGPIPYKPEAAAKKKENQEHWLERDPEIKCYLP